MATQTTNFDLTKPELTDKFEDFLQSYNANLDIIDQNMGGGGGSGGHTIYDSDGNAMPQRAGLQFDGNINITDDSADDKTIVEVLGGGGTPISLVPTMNSNSQDGYIARADTEWSTDYQAYEVFDNNVQTAWAPSTSGQSWVEIEMPSPKKATKFRITTRSGYYYASSITVQGSNDGTTYTNLGAASGLTSGETVEISNTSSTEYLIYRFVVNDFGLAEIYIEGIEGGGGTDIHYSTEEQVIGTWIDGSTIYEKTFEINKSSFSSGNATIQHGIANFDKLINYTGRYSDSSDNWSLIPNISSVSEWSARVRDFNSLTYVLETGGNIYNSFKDKVYLTFQYTKTSVAPMSITKAYDNTSSGASDFTVSTSGRYLLIVSYSYSSLYSITLPSGRTAVASGNLGTGCGFDWVIADLQVGDVVSMSATPANWVAFAKTAYLLSGIAIDSLVDSATQSDGTATLTPPSNSNKYLMFGTGMGRVASYPRNDTNTSGLTFDASFEGSVGVNTIVGIYYANGSDLPTGSFYGYDGGGGLIALFGE